MRTCPEITVSCGQCQFHGQDQDHRVRMVRVRMVRVVQVRVVMVDRVMVRV